jgi:hypothetical protein
MPIKGVGIAWIFGLKCKQVLAISDDQKHGLPSCRALPQMPEHSEPRSLDIPCRRKRHECPEGSGGFGVGGTTSAGCTATARAFRIHSDNETPADAAAPLNAIASSLETCRLMFCFVDLIKLIKFMVGVP